MAGIVLECDDGRAWVKTLNELVEALRRGDAQEAQVMYDRILQGRAR